jgi:Leucine-rich repeat (LRR) protein
LLPEINLNEFDDLTQLILKNTKIKKLELRSLPKLQKLDVSGCLSKINLNGFDNLTQLILSDTKIEKLELRSLPKLRELHVSGCL